MNEANASPRSSVGSVSVKNNKNSVSSAADDYVIPKSSAANSCFKNYMQIQFLPLQMTA
jgi:hypothetical protein